MDKYFISFSFPSASTSLDWVRDPYISAAVAGKDMALQKKLTWDKIVVYKPNFADLPLDSFWLTDAKEFSILAKSSTEHTCGRHVLIPKLLDQLINLKQYSRTHDVLIAYWSARNAPQLV